MYVAICVCNTDYIHMCLHVEVQLLLAEIIHPRAYGIKSTLLYNLYFSLWYIFIIIIIIIFIQLS